MRIDKLTPQQEAMMAEVRDEWIAVGLSTAPANRKEAEGAIGTAYECAGLEPPERFVWCGSPLSGNIVAGILTTMRDGKIKLPDGTKPVGASVWASVRASVGDSVRDSVRDSVGDSVRDSVWDSVWDSARASVGDSVGDSVRVSVWDSVWASVGASVGVSVRDSVWASVGASVGASVRDSVRDSVWDSVGASVGVSVGDSVRAEYNRTIWGQHEADWLSFYDFFRRCGLESETQKLRGLWGVARHCGWWWGFEKVAVLTERPCFLQRDERGRLHSEDGPALVYPDGFAVFAVHGVRVPQDVIQDKSSITIERIRKEQNAEVKRIMRERYGQDRYLKDTGAKVIDVDVVSIHEMTEGADSIVRALMEDEEGRRFLVGSDGSTGRTYFMESPNTVQTCKEAHSFLCGFDESRIIAQS